MFLSFRRYFDFGGRARRTEFWLFTLFVAFGYFVIVFGWSLALGVTGGSPSSAFDDPDFFDGIGAIPVAVLMLMWLLATIIPGIAVTVRRLHDAGITGWIYLVLVITGFFVPFLPNIAWLILMMIPGTKGANAYGNDPRGGISVEVFE